MASMDEDPFATRVRKVVTTHEVGQPLDTLSVSELEERIALLQGEMLRLEARRDERAASKKAADAFFKS